MTTLGGDGLSISNDALTVDTAQGLEITDGSVIPSSTQVDATADFSGPTLNQMDTTVSNGDLVLQNTVDLESLANSVGSKTSTGNWPPQGIEVSASKDFDKLRVGIGANASGATRVSLRTDPGTIETQKNFPGSSGSVTFDYAFTSGETYYITAEEENDSDWTYGYDLDSPTTINGNIVSIVYGEEDNGSWNTGEAWVIQEITPISDAFDGEATVEWSNPSSVSRWETATYQDVPDGETVEVYVQTNDGNGWSDWSTNPVGSGIDLSAIPSDHRVRFRVELSRNDTSDNPRVTLLSRQYRP